MIKISSRYGRYITVVILSALALCVLSIFLHNIMQRRRFFQAVTEGNLQRVQEYVADGFDINRRDRYSDTALIIASYYGHEEIVRLLLEENADVNMANRSNGAAIHFASENGHLEIVELLLDAKADLWICMDWSPLHDAAISGNADVVDILAQKMGSVNFYTGTTRFTPLHFVKTAAAAEVLIHHGAIIDARNIDGDTPLHSAVNNDRADVVKVLIDNGADVDAKNNHLRTPLFNAVLGVEKEIVEYLLKAGANVNAQDDEGQTPLFNLRWHKDTVIAELLVEHGARLDVKNYLDLTPLQNAMLFRRDSAIIQYLYEIEKEQQSSQAKSVP